GRERVFQVRGVMVGDTHGTPPGWVDGCHGGRGTGCGWGKAGAWPSGNPRRMPLQAGYLPDNCCPGLREFLGHPVGRRQEAETGVRLRREGALAAPPSLVVYKGVGRFASGRLLLQFRVLDTGLPGRLQGIEVVVVGTEGEAGLSVVGAEEALGLGPGL